MYVKRTCLCVYDTYPWMPGQSARAHILHTHYNVCAVWHDDCDGDVSSRISPFVGARSHTLYVHTWYGCLHNTEHLNLTHAPHATHIAGGPSSSAGRARQRRQRQVFALTCWWLVVRCFFFAISFSGCSVVALSSRPLMISLWPRGKHSHTHTKSRAVKEHQHRQLYRIRTQPPPPIGHTRLNKHTIGCAQTGAADADDSSERERKRI